MLPQYLWATSVKICIQCLALYQAEVSPQLILVAIALLNIFLITSLAICSVPGTGVNNAITVFKTAGIEA